MDHVTSHRYDAADNEIETMGASGNMNRFIYHSHFNKLTETDPLGYTTAYTCRRIRVDLDPKRSGFTSTNLYDLRSSP